jgi:hypothetical protein
VTLSGRWSLLRHAASAEGAIHRDRRRWHLRCGGREDHDDQRRHEPALRQALPRRGRRLPTPADLAERTSTGPQVHEL